MRPSCPDLLATILTIVGFTAAIALAVHWSA